MVDMVDSLKGLFKDGADRAKELADVRDAYKDVPFKVPGHND
eukprot:SAG31_NODE_23440_length_504_cov_1.007407_1_plen_42_part_00